MARLNCMQKIGRVIMAIPVDKLAEEIAKGLAEYSKEATEVTKAAVDKVSKEAVAELKSSSPKKTGAYARGWASKKSYEDTRSKRNSVYNKTKHQITHLLEKGHAKRNGGRVSAKVHIAPVDEKIQKNLETYIEKGLPS